MALIPVVLSLLVLGAHFFRAGLFPFVALVVLLLALVWIRKPWAARVLQVALILGGVEWARTLIEIAQRRLAEGQPYARLIAILGCVALITAGSALLFLTRGMKRRYGLDGGR
jgi:hypothetical protein